MAPLRWVPRHTAPPGRRRGSRKSPPSSPWRPRAPARSKRAQSFLDKALQIVDTTGERWLAAELNRRRGQLLLQRDADAAEERYGQALSIAGEQQARLWEPRAGLSLAAGARSAGAGLYLAHQRVRHPDLTAAARCSANSVPSPLDFSSISSAISVRIWHAPSKKSRGKRMTASSLLGRSPAVWARSPKGHEERFPGRRLRVR